MKNILFALVCVICGFCNYCYCQSVTNWGAAISGIQLSITLSNHIIQIGSNTVLVARIKNSSSNSIVIGETGEALRDLEVLLIDSAGHTNRIQRKGTFIANVIHNGLIAIHPGQTREKNVPFELDGNIGPGQFIVQAKQLFMFKLNGKLDASTCSNVVSNPIEVRVE